MKLWMDNYKLMKKNDELLRILKAIIKKACDGEIVISRQELAETGNYNIYETKQYMCDAKRYQVINKYKNRTGEVE
jgi:hypothetical protein